MSDNPLVLKIDKVSHQFEDKRVLHDVNLGVARGEIVGLVGPSGCGKSTLLRAILGTHPPTEGRVTVLSGPDGNLERQVLSPGPECGIVYQRYTLFPFLSARKNVMFGLKLHESTLPGRFLRPWKWLQMQRRHRVAASDWLAKMGLKDAFGHYPHELSGGMQQRVAIAQALIMKPQLLLLDEPFGALDEAMREVLQRMLLRLYLENLQAKQRHEQPPYTILIVTHELNEAIYVSDRVVGLSQFWNWKEQGHENCPGATIVYDCPTPVFGPDDDPNPELFKGQREEIQRAVFDPNFLESKECFKRFWAEVQRGNGRGIMS